jgi:hypothetical protein
MWGRPEIKCRSDGLSATSVTSPSFANYKLRLTFLYWRLVQYFTSNGNQTWFLNQVLRVTAWWSGLQRS